MYNHKTLAKKTLGLLKYPLMIFLVGYLIYSGKLDFQLLKSYVSLENLLYLALVFVILLVSQSCCSKRYEVFITALGFMADFKTVFNVVMTGLFYNNFLPGGTGGDLLRVYYIKRIFGVPLAVGTAVTLLDRILAVFALMMVAVVSFACTYFFMDYDSAAVGIRTELIMLVLLIPIAVVFCLCLLRIPSIYKLLEVLLNKIIFGRHLVSMLATSRAVMQNTAVLLKTLALGLAVQILTILCVAILAYSLYGIQAVWGTMAMAGIVFIITAVPVTPGNIGWTEWVADTLYKLMGVEGGATIFMVWRLVSLLFSLIGGVIYLRMDKPMDGENSKDIANND